MSFPAGAAGVLIWVLVLVVIIVLIVYLIHALLFVMPVEAGNGTLSILQNISNSSGVK